MSDPISFEGATPRLSLPLLFPGQSQKEFYVNEALLRAEIVVQCVVEGESNAPPASPQPGQVWLVGPSPGAEFASHAGEIACYSGSGWRFVVPTEGFSVYDRSLGALRLRRDGWVHCGSPAPPSGGTSADLELRAVVLQIVERLAQLGIFAAS